MKAYSSQTNIGRKKAIEDIHHKTCDGGALNRLSVAKAQRKAARLDGKKQINEELK